MKDKVRKTRRKTEYFRRLLAAVFALFIVFTAIPVFADDPYPGTLTVSVPVLIKGGGKAMIEGSDYVNRADDPEGETLAQGWDRINGSALMPKETEITAADDAVFEWEFSARDVVPGQMFSYKIRQIPGSDPAAVYDQTEYILEIYIFNNDEDAVTAYAQLRNDSADGTERLRKPEKAEFINIRSAPCEADPPVKKIVKGSPGSDDEFVFTMKPVSNTAGLEKTPMPGGLDTQEITIKGSGEYEFGTIVFTVPGVYEYEIREIDTGKPYYIYDTSVYKLTVTVTRQPDNTLKAESVYDKGGEKSQIAVFINTYSRSSPSGKQPDTGDRNDMLPYIAIAGACAAAVIIIIIVLAVKRGKNKKNKKNDI